MCQIGHTPGRSSFSFCVKKGRQNGPYSQLHFDGFKPRLARSIPAFRLHIADIPPTRSSPIAILIYPDPLYLPTGCPFCGQSYPYDGVPRPFFGTEWPCPHSGLPSRMCARTFPCSGRGSAASAPHGLGNLRALPFSWSCKTPSSASGKSGRRRLTCAA